MIEISSHFIYWYLTLAIITIIANKMQKSCRLLPSYRQLTVEQRQHQDKNEERYVTIFEINDGYSDDLKPICVGFSEKRSSKLIIYSCNVIIPKSIIIDYMQTPVAQHIQTDCVICLQIADQALVTTCCTKLICEVRCKSCLQVNNKCPYCTKQNFQANPENYIRRFCRQVSQEIQIFTKRLQGGNIMLRMKQLDTVEMLFQRIYEKEGIQIESLRVSFEGKNVRNSKKSLRSLGIKDQSTIHILLRLKGGVKYE